MSAMGNCGNFRPSQLDSFRYDQWLDMRVGEALQSGPKQPRRQAKQVGLTKGDVKRLVKSMVIQLAEQFFGQQASFTAGVGGLHPPDDSDYIKGKGKAAATAADKGKGKNGPKGATTTDKGGPKGKGKSGKGGKDSATPLWRPPDLHVFCVPDCGDPGANTQAHANPPDGI